MDHGPFIVVSDLHLGSYNCNADEFSHFCDWLEVLEREGSKRVIITDDSGEQEERPIYTPKTLILLGDVLELWDPRLEDHTAGFRDSFTIFDKLLALSCKKVYVLGNHDEELSDYYSDTERRGDADQSFVPQDYRSKNGSLLLIVDGHYPNYSRKRPNQPSDSKRRKELARKEWKQAGKTKYIFLHGHQFDKMFRRVGPLRYIPEYMARGASFFGNKHKWIGPLCFVVLLISTVLLATNWMNLLAVPGILAILVVLLVLGLVGGVPWAWVTVQKPAWRYFFKHFAERPNYEELETVIDEDYYDCNKDLTLGETVIVFGHTHVPEIACVDRQQMKKRGKKCKNESGNENGQKTFINCGAWVTPTDQDPRSRVATNTLVYIDSKDHLLLQWDDCKRDVFYYMPSSRAKYSVLKTKWH